MVKYQQHNDPTCHFSSLASALHAIGDHVAAELFFSRLSDSLQVLPSSLVINNRKYKSRIDYAHDVITNHIKILHSPKCNYQCKVYKPGKEFDILKNRSEFPTLVQLVDLHGNMQHCVTLAGKWIFDSNFPQALLLTEKILMLVALIQKKMMTVMKKTVNGFDCVYRAIRFMPTKKNKCKFLNLL